MRVTGEFFQGGGEAGGVAGQPAGEELQHFGEFTVGGASRLVTASAISGGNGIWAAGYSGTSGSFNPLTLAHSPASQTRALAPFSA